MPFEGDRICAVVAAPTAAEMARRLRCVRRSTRTVEVRLDWLRSTREISRLFDLLGIRPHLVGWIATCRRREAGGRFVGGLAQQWSKLLAAAASGFGWCDLEVETAEALDETLKKLVRRLGARLLISYHDFRRTPRRLDAVVRRLERCGGDAVKIATHCRSISDSVRLLALARRRRNVVAVPMGEFGLPARVLALRSGSALAYAAAGQATAPGQLSLDDMKRLYRADRLNSRTRVYGVIGDPVAHSLSPLLHNTAFLARRIDAVYLPFRVRELRDFLGAIRPLGIAGFSVTLPNKRAILRHLDGCDPLARAIGAVNTVVVRGGGKLYGYNTDYVGVLRALERRMRLRASRVLIYGAGGAARAAAFALAQAGAVVCICARSPGKARALARAAGGQVTSRAGLRRGYFDAIINATPVGMLPGNASPLGPAELNCRVVMDLIYRPQKTRLLRLAERRGIQTVSGVEMFLAQGMAQWEIWTGLRAPQAAMRRVVIKALRDEEKARG